MAESKDLRSQFLKVNPFRSVDAEVELPEVGKVKVRLRQPSVEERNRIMAAAQTKTAQGLSEAQALAVVLCARNPEGDARVFEESDVASLCTLPAGSWVDELSSQVMQLLADGSDAAKKS